MQNAAKVVMRFDVIRTAFYCPAICPFSVVQAILMTIKYAEVVVDIGSIGRENQRLAVFSLGIAKALQLLKRITERGSCLYVIRLQNENSTIYAFRILQRIKCVVGIGQPHKRIRVVWTNRQCREKYHLRFLHALQLM
nr:hypothetical protein [Caballeronia sp. GAWG2-1]